VWAGPARPSPGNDLTYECWIKTKAALFVFPGVSAAGLILVEKPTGQELLWLLITV